MINKQSLLLVPLPSDKTSHHLTSHLVKIFRTPGQPVHSTDDICCDTNNTFLSISLGICDCFTNIWPSCICSFFICDGAWVLAQSKYYVHTYWSRILLIRNTPCMMLYIYMQSILVRIIDVMIATTNLILEHRIISIWHRSCPKIRIHKFQKCSDSVLHRRGNMHWNTVED